MSLSSLSSDDSFSSQSHKNSDITQEIESTYNMDSVESINRKPPPVRYEPVQSSQADWYHFRAIHAFSGVAISCQTWAKLVSKHPQLGMELCNFLKALKIDRMVLECRPFVNKGRSIMNPFEFAVGSAPDNLENKMKADPTPFAEQLFSTLDDDAMDTDGEEDVNVEVEQSIGCVFEAEDSTSVLPRPSSQEDAINARFANLSNYIQGTSPQETGKLLSVVATEYEKIMSKAVESEWITRVYLSTNTGGSFLNFRLEHTPKNYIYQAFVAHSETPATNNGQPNTSSSLPLRIQIASDLHTEFYGLEATQAPKHLIVPSAPVLALVGDIGIAITDSLRDFLHMQADNFDKVIYIVGNHEFYNVKQRTRSVTEQWEWLRSVCSERGNIYLLEKGSMDIGGVRILGTALWSFIPDEMLQDAEMALNDYNLSYNHSKGEATRMLTAKDTRTWFHENLKWLFTEHEKAREEGIPTLVLTHHTPKRAGTSHPRFDNDPMTCCFSSDLPELLSSPVKAWVCGHTHYNFDIDNGGTRLVSNQRGYKGSAKSDYRRDLVLEIDAIL